MDNITEEQKKAKYEAVKKELKGLDVTYSVHSISMHSISKGSKVPDMARVNGHSIIWHWGAYAEPDEPEVEIYLKGADDVEGHVPIKGLRERVSG